MKELPSKVSNYLFYELVGRFAAKPAREKIKEKQIEIFNSMNKEEIDSLASYGKRAGENGSNSR